MSPGIPNSSEPSSDEITLVSIDSLSTTPSGLTKGPAGCLGCLFTCDRDDIGGDASKSADPYCGFEDDDPRGSEEMTENNKNAKRPAGASLVFESDSESDSDDEGGECLLGDFRISLSEAREDDIRRGATIPVRNDPPETRRFGGRRINTIRPDYDSPAERRRAGPLPSGLQRFSHKGQQGSPIGLSPREYIELYRPMVIPYFKGGASVCSSHSGVSLARMNNPSVKGGHHSASGVPLSHSTRQTHYDFNSNHASLAATDNRQNETLPGNRVHTNGRRSTVRAEPSGQFPTLRAPNSKHGTHNGQQNPRNGSSGITQGRQPSPEMNTLSTKPQELRRLDGSSKSSPRSRKHKSRDHFGAELIPTTSRRQHPKIKSPKIKLRQLT